jgi:hypothetical protein
MDVVAFWNLITHTSEISNRHTEDQATLLINELSRMPEEEIVDFYAHWLDQMDRANTYGLWAAAYIINCGCSDDGFADFRAWLIAQGYLLFDRAIQNPDVLAEDVELPTSTQSESLLYVAKIAYRRKTNREFPILSRSNTKVKGEKWVEDDFILQQKCPHLYARFGDCEQ